MKYHYSVDMESDNSLSVILRNIKPGSKVFEFGPSDGYMTEYLKNNLKCQVFCLEIDAKAAEAAEKFCDRMFVADLNTFDWQDQLKEDLNTFDYLIYADVLEHLVNPQEVLKSAVQKLLKQDGIVLSSIPNIGHTAVILELLQGEFRYRKTGLLDNTHIHFFTRSSIETMLGHAGLSLLDSHNICMYPEQTELESSYKCVPETVGTYLRNKIDAHVYQFIVIAQKSKDTSQGHTIVPHNSYRLSKFIQLFWNDGEGYTESNSKRLPLQVEDTYSNYVFEVESNEGHFLRIDPTNFPAFIHIRSCKIWGLNPNKNTFEFIEDGSKRMKLLHGLIPLSDQKKGSFFSLSKDPSFEFQLAASESITYSSYRIELEMLFASQSDSNFIRTWIEEINNKLTGLEADQEKARESFATQEEQLTHLIESQSELNKQFSDMCRLQENMQNERDKALENYNQIISSPSWKITQPLRAIRRLFAK